MAQDRLTYLIRQFRIAIGDEFDRDGNLITNFITDDGAVWSAEAVKNFAVQGVNALIDRFVSQFEDTPQGLDFVARKFREYVRTATHGGVSGTGGIVVAVSASECYLPTPSDFAYLLSVRYRYTTTGGTVAWRTCDTRHSYKSIDNTRSANAEHSKYSLATTIGDEIHVYAETGLNLISTEVFLTYFRRQADITLGGADDILLKRYDLEILALMRQQAESFQGVRIG